MTEPKRGGTAWTAEQREALVEREDALLVANAGTGKTTTVVGKILWHLGLDVGTDADGRPIPPCEDPCELHQVAAITFTEKAAYDLKEKLRRRIAASERGAELRWQIDRASIGTIHAFCASLLREHALRLGIDPTFRVLEEREARVEQEAILRDAILERLEAGDDGVARLVQDRGLDGFTFQAGAVGLARAAMRDVRWHGRRYDDWRGADGELDARALLGLCGADDERGDAERLAHCAALYRVAADALDEWDEFQRRQNVRDFDSLVLDARRLLTEERGDAALQAIRRRFRILIIDEFQDTDFAQRDIAFAIAGRGAEAEGPQLFLVGDPKQSIYRFRGADIAVWNEVERDIGKVLRLTRNFRSARAIIDFVNAASSEALTKTGAALGEEEAASRVGYTDLVVGREELRGGVEWLSPENERWDSVRRAKEAPMVARRILEMIGREVVEDPEKGTRALAFRDIAILFRNRTGLEAYEAELRRHGIPYYISGQAGLSGRQEVADLVNALRVVHNPLDDLALFGFLRSPFVGLRDEVLARMRLENPRRSLIAQSREFLAAARERVEADDDVLPIAMREPELRAAEGLVRRTELESLERGLDALRWAERLGHRLPLDELLRGLLEKTGYRNHLLFFDGHREAFSNVESLLRLVEEHRDLPLDTFLAIWDRWDDADAGLPQAQLYSADDDVVTLMTMHSAKGLEWPVVFLIDVAQAVRDKTANDYWTDPAYGPAFPPSKSDRGPRDLKLAARRLAQNEAEEARLAYVATTRAMERLVVVAPEDSDNGYVPWLRAGRDALGLRPRTAIPEREALRASPAIGPGWLRAVGPGEPDPMTRVLPRPTLRYMTSATERMMRANRQEEWELRYLHGVEPVWVFDPESSDRVPAHVRGTLIHSVLERLHERDELSRLLEEAIGELDAPDLQRMLARGREARDALEVEIERIVTSDEWSWYTDGEHYREMPFVHRLEDVEWAVGSFDLYRPRREADDHGWIIDFKTHDVSAGEARGKAKGYRIQADLYRDAASELDAPVRVRLHFTRPNVIVDMDGADEGPDAEPPRFQQGDLFGP